MCFLLTSFLMLDLYLRLNYKTLRCCWLRTLIDDYLTKEIKFGRVFGPTETPPFSTLVGLGYTQKASRMASYFGFILPV